MSAPIRLQDVFESHVHRLFQLRDAVIGCHSGLAGLTELHWNQYRSALPPEPRGEKSPVSFTEVSHSSRLWLFASALKDALGLQIAFFEQIRQFTEVAFILSKNLPETEKKQLVSLKISTRPAQTANAYLEEFDRLLGPAFHCRAEVESLFILLAAALAGVNSREPAPGEFPRDIKLLVPSIQTPVPGNDGRLNYEVEPVAFTVPAPRDLSPSPELFYKVFFTAFAIARDLANACQTVLNAHSTPQPQ